MLMMRNPKNRPKDLGGPAAELPPWVSLMLSTPEVDRLLSRASSWDFDIWAFDEATNRNPMVALVVHYVQAFDLDLRLNLNMSKLVAFLTKLQAGYHDVPFHNFVHACDVVHGTVFFAAQDAVRKHLSALDLYAIILAAAMHDHGHVGYSNAFYVNANDELAIRYNDASVLESYHLASSWRLMLDDASDPFAGFTREQYLDARQTIVQAILGTDMKVHFSHLTKFKTHSSSGALDDPDRDGVRGLLTMCLHAADVSNPGKPWKLCVHWAARIMKEFFHQGDKEAEMGLTVSPFMDREKTNIAQCQIGFVDFLIRPFFEEWTGWIGEKVSREVLGHVTANLATWGQEGEAALGEMLSAVKSKSPKHSPMPPHT